MNEKLDEIISLLKEIKQTLVGQDKTTTFAGDPNKYYGGGGGGNPYPPNTYPPCTYYAGDLSCNSGTTKTIIGDNKYETHTA